MMERIEAEVALIRSEHPGLEFRSEDFWARIPEYPLPPGWDGGTRELAFQMPRDLFGQEPYGFWVRPFLLLPAGGAPSNSSGPVATGFGEGFQQFSWAPEAWRPGPDPLSGTNMLDWVRSFGRRLKELN
jgi:hypothetical protein